MSKLCLNMIVRNESDRIIRALQSALPFVSTYAIADTGSTDDTIEKIVSFFASHGINGEILKIEFKDFSQARNAAFDHALTMWQSGEYDFQYLLLMDADMELVVEDRLPTFTGMAYDMVQKAGTLSYSNRRIANVLAVGRYVGPTHEYLDVPAAGLVSGAYFIDHADGSNRDVKLTRDAALLEAAVARDPKNGRNWYYLGQTYREAGAYEAAITAYQKRVDVGGWDEETWSAKVNIAHCHKALGRHDKFVEKMLEAYSARPTRAEALYDLAKFMREHDMPEAGALFAKAGLAIKRPNDALFVSDLVYDIGLTNELSISGYYDKALREEGFAACNKVLLSPKTPGEWRRAAKSNMQFYLHPLSRFAPSFTAKVIPFAPPEGWRAMNPTAVAFNGDVLLNVRCVNYTIQPNGSYLVRDGDYYGEITRDHPIRTRNFLMTTGGNKQQELVWLSDAPKYREVLGMEDVRLWTDRDNRLRGVANIRQLNAQGICQQVAFQVEPGELSGGVFLTTPLSSLDRHEKNWMPVTGYDHTFMYDCRTVINSTTHPRNLDVVVDDIRGGPALVPFNAGYLTVTHEAVARADGSRIYWHRFAWFDKDLTLRRFSPPFVFDKPQIEFCIGLAPVPGKDQHYVTYGVRDEQAMIGTIDNLDIASMLLWLGD